MVQFHVGLCSREGEEDASKSASISSSAHRQPQHFPTQSEDGTSFFSSPVLHSKDSLSYHILAQRRFPFSHVNVPPIRGLRGNISTGANEFVYLEKMLIMRDLKENADPVTSSIVDRHCKWEKPHHVHLLVRHPDPHNTRCRPTVRRHH